MFFDTPGLVREREIKKHHLEQSFMSAYRHAIQHADMIGVVHDVSNGFTRNALHPSVLKVLTEYHNLPHFLVLNKIDAVKSKRLLLDLIRILTKGYLDGEPYGQKFNKQFKAKKIKDREEQTDSNKEKENETLKAEVGYDKFKEVFLVSAIEGDGVNKIMVCGTFLCFS